MEEIYPPEIYGASIHFPLKRYFDEFKNMFLNEDTINSFSNEENENNIHFLLTMKNLMELELNEIKYLSEACNIDLLTCEGENTKDFPMEIPDNLNSNSKLPHTLITNEMNQLEVNKCRDELESKKPTVQASLVYKRSFPLRLEFSIPSTPPDLTPHSDFILSILIYRPFAFSYFNTKNASEKLRFNHEIVALGRNTLAELRDAIICSSDDGLCKEVQSTTDDLRSLADAKSKYPSGFIFIDNTFYNDFRHPNSIDYSIPVLEWAKEKKIKNLKTENIENTRLDSLTPRFGYPYLYMHQGDCEHLLVFSDATLLDSSDCLHSQCYPHVLKLNRKANKMCFMCGIAFAKWICVGSDRLPQHKVFLCTDCCNSYNYSNGEKIGKFQLYPYYEKHVVRN